jgi:cytochrome c-type biogenesis protein CcmH
MRDRYGDFILFRPQFSWRNAWLWIAPFALLLIGIGVAIRIIRERAALAPADASLPETGEVAESGRSRGGADGVRS